MQNMNHTVHTVHTTLVEGTVLEKAELFLAVVSLDPTPISPYLLKDDYGGVGPWISSISVGDEHCLGGVL